jgi:ATP-dependent RNA helicase RhlE
MDDIRTENAGFRAFGIDPRLLAVMEKAGFTVPTDIQAKAIAPGLEGKDIVGIAQTGTGKTLAFAVPMLERLLRASGKYGLVVVPTRELAMQVEETFMQVGGPLGLVTALIIGGAPMGRQISALRRGPHVVIGTPGRINDHLEHRTIDLSRVAALVLDEADRMLDIGFLPQLRRILQSTPADRQTMLFSATMPDDIYALANAHMRQPLRIEIARPGTVADNVSQEFFIASREEKRALLARILTEHEGSALVFCRTKYGAQNLRNLIASWGHAACELHSNRSLGQRKQALDRFKSGACRVLVATDIAARGIDVSDIALVVNYDLPEQAEDYVHRIGRTARAGKAGKAISFAMPTERRKLHAIERLIRVAIAISRMPAEPNGERTAPEPLGAERPAPAANRFRRRSFSGHGGRGHRGFRRFK